MLIPLTLDQTPFCHSKFFLINDSNHFTLHCIECLFHIVDTMNLVESVMFVERYETIHQKTLKRHFMFLVPSQRFQHFRHLFQNQKPFFSVQRDPYRF